MDFQPRPNIDKVVIDDDVFHDLMHSLLKCKGYPGGRRRHVEYAWEYRWGPWIRSHTRCLLGIHRKGQWWQRNLTWVGCTDCHKKLSNPQPE